MFSRRYSLHPPFITSTFSFLLSKCLRLYYPLGVSSTLHLLPKEFGVCCTPKRPGKASQLFLPSWRRRMSLGCWSRYVFSFRDPSTFGLIHRTGTRGRQSTNAVPSYLRQVHACAGRAFRGRSASIIRLVAFSWRHCGSQCN